MPTTCEAEVSWYVTEEPEDFERIRSRMNALEARNEGITLEVEPGSGPPDVQPTPESLEIYEQAREMAKRDRLRPEGAE